MKLRTAHVQEIHSVNDSVYCVRLGFEEVFESAPGQFVEIRVSELDVPLLRRPISISRQVDDMSIELLVREIGIGTALMRQWKKGEAVDLIGPLGTGFDLEGLNRESRVLLVGGGIGIAPMRGLSDALRDLLEEGPTVVNGFREDPFGGADFQGCDYHEVDESTQGGFVTEYIENRIRLGGYHRVYACGPHPMLARMKVLCEAAGVPLQVSLEEKMACGIGVCLGCAVKIRTGDFSYTYKKVCVDGPVFDSREVIFHD